MATLINGTEGMRCEHAFVSCEEAIDMFGHDSPPQVILLDIGLPGINGIQGIEKFKELLPKIFLMNGEGKYRKYTLNEIIKSLESPETIRQK